MSYLLFSVTCWQIKYFLENFPATIRKWGFFHFMTALININFFLKRWADAAHFEFVSLGNLFLGADWIWTLKFLCLTRQVSIPWPCFTFPSIWLVPNTKIFSCTRMQISWSNSNGNSVLHHIWELSERCQCNLGCNPHPQQDYASCAVPVRNMYVPTQHCLGRGQVFYAA